MENSQCPDWRCTYRRAASNNAAHLIWMAVCLAISAPCSLAHSDTIHYTTIALSGEPAPGTPDGVVFEALTNSAVDRFGNVVFAGHVSGPGVNGENDFGYWANTEDNLQLVIRRNTPADGLERFNFAATTGGPDYSNGQLFLPLHGSVDQQATNYILKGIPGDMQLVTHVGAAVPSLVEGDTLGEFQDESRFNAQGNVALTGYLSREVETVPEVGLWTADADGLHLVAQSGMRAPGLADGVVFAPSEFRSGVPYSGMQFNDEGQIAISGVVTGPGINPTNERAIWVGTAGNLELVARAGDELPGQSDLIYIADSLSRIELSNSGTVVLQAAAKDPTDDSILDVLVVGTPGAMTTLPIDVTDFDINSNDVLAFNSSGIYRGTVDDLELVVPRTTSALGLDPSERIDEYRNVAINDRDEIMFWASTTSPNGRGLGIWVVDHAGTTHRVIARGDLLEIRPGDTREVRDLFFGPGISEGGHVSFGVQFVDDSFGLMVAQVPELSALRLACFAVIGVACIRLRRRVCWTGR